jgi:tRNA (guanine6-N2)-methyltransferase
MKLQRKRKGKKNSGIKAGAPDKNGCFCFMVLDGTRDIVNAELRKCLGSQMQELQHSKRNEIHFKYSGPLKKLLSIRTAQTLFVRRDFEISRPRTLLSPEIMEDVVAWIQSTSQMTRNCWHSFRIDAAGSQSPTMLRIANAIENALGLPYEPETGDGVLAMRPGEYGWELLCRIGSRPLATRSWRQTNYRGSLNAAIAASMVLMTQPQPRDRVINIMCGGGTLLIERMLVEKAVLAVGLDISHSALNATFANTLAAGVASLTDIVKGDANFCGFAKSTFNVVMIDLPYRAGVGQRRGNNGLYRQVLKEAARLCKIGGRAVVITADYPALHFAISNLEDEWAVKDDRIITQRQYKPQCLLLQRI